MVEFGIGHGGQPNLLLHITDASQPVEREQYQIEANRDAPHIVGGAPARRTYTTRPWRAKLIHTHRCRENMLVTREREKLCQAIVFFSEHTKKLGKTKLFKLLYFLDFEHFKLTGRSVTGLHYFAWPKGPVPKNLFDEFEKFAPDLAEHIRIKELQTFGGGNMQKVVALSRFDKRHFSKRELNLMEKLAKEYRTATATQMVEATHLDNKPWHQVFEVEGRRQAEIPYELALNRQETEDMQRHVRERREILQNYKK